MRNRMSAYAAVMWQVRAQRRACIFIDWWRQYLIPSMFAKYERVDATGANVDRLIINVHASAAWKHTTVYVTFLALLLSAICSFDTYWRPPDDSRKVLYVLPLFFFWHPRSNLPDDREMLRIPEVAPRPNSQNSLRHFAHPSPVLQGVKKSRKFGLDFWHQSPLTDSSSETKQCSGHLTQTWGTATRAVCALKIWYSSVSPSLRNWRSFVAPSLKFLSGILGPRLYLSNGWSYKRQICYVDWVQEVVPKCKISEMQNKG